MMKAWGNVYSNPLLDRANASHLVAKAHTAVNLYEYLILPKPCLQPHLKLQEQKLDTSIINPLPPGGMYVYAIDCLDYIPSVIHVHICHGAPVPFSRGMYGHAAHASPGSEAWATKNTAQERGLLYQETTWWH